MVSIQERETATPLARLARPFQEFIARETAGGILLLACTVVALFFANSPWAVAYARLWHAPLIGRSGGDLRFVVNDALMAVFFFVVGLEIRRELMTGELASRRRAALPVLAALGGVLVPALLYTSLNWGGQGALGWGIPIATDIAFAIGVLALLGKRVPLGLKVFLTALAIVDDIAAVIAIALFYTADLRWTALGLAGVCVVLLLAANRLGVRRVLPYAIGGIMLWSAVLASGVHATIAGVLLAFTIPSPALSEKLERQLHPWVTFGIMPLFALANAGVALSGDVSKAAGNVITLGVVLGLMLGKPLGITLASWLAVRLGWASLPAGVSWKQIHGAGWLAGIGFTMAFFMAGLSFTDNDTAALTAAKLGILTGSLCAGIIGSAILARVTAKNAGEARA